MVHAGRRNPPSVDHCLASDFGIRKAMDDRSWWPRVVPAAGSLSGEWQKSALLCRCRGHQRRTGLPPWTDRQTGHQASDL